MHLNQGLPLLILGVCMVFILIMKGCCGGKMQEWGYTFSTTNMEVDENLPNFFEAVKLADADWVVFENQNMREVYGFSMVPIWLEQRLDDWSLAKKPVRGVAWYNLLANPIYSRRFNYIEVNVPSRSDLIVDGDSDEENDCEQSDMVQILLNMAYAPRKVVKSFTFGPGISKEFKQAMADQKAGESSEITGIR